MSSKELSLLTLGGLESNRLLIVEIINVSIGFLHLLNFFV